MKKRKGLKIVVTGGAGFIGSWVIDYLIREFKNKIDQIVVLDNFTRGTIHNLKSAVKSNKIKTVKGDIRDPEIVNKVIKGADFVIHEAVIRITQCADNPRLCNEILVDGAFNVLEACVKNKVKKLVFNSSASVYGQPSYLPMDENHPFNNDTAYGAAKIANEQMAKAFHKMYGLKYVCLRPFNAYGPRMDIYGAYTEVLVRWLDRIDQGLAPIIFGDGKQSMDFVYVEDIARATILALKSKVEKGVYNVASGKETSLNQLVRMLLKLTKSKLKPVYESPRTVYHVTRRRADIKLARKELGFIAKTSLKEGLKKLIEWRKEVKKNENSVAKAGI